MQFKFDPNQEFQIRAIDAIASLFAGQHRTDVTLEFSGAGLASVPNVLNLTDDALLENLQAVQAANGLIQDRALLQISATVPTAEGSTTVAFPNFSVEMETGTGKTYVYLRTALELHRHYGFRKFLVVVPSIAIREGVLKTLQVTRQHLRDLYDNLPYRSYVYDSASLAQVRQFALSDAVELMVMTIDSFNRATNVLRQSTDRLQGETPIHVIQATCPILILDEPQNMESELSIRSLAALNPLFALRYSATHRNLYNLVYRLTPYDAYRQGLVKRIEVASVLQEDDANRPYVRFVNIALQKHTLTAHLAVHRRTAAGTIKEEVVAVRPGDSLVAKANRADYQGYDIEEIDAHFGFVRFANQIELQLGESVGTDMEAIFAAQLRYTVEEHLRRQARLRPLGIKVLSLFFIDRVDNYAPGGSLLRRLFADAFSAVKTRYPEWHNLAPDQVQAAYFAQRRKGGDVELLDSDTARPKKEDEAAYDLIMKDKERLLSFDEPVAFIFSHSALREGWDNPNVFQICTLNQTVSDVKKRQEIGRGVRLAVNQAGDRVRDEAVNVLTVVANESYERYVEQLQSEFAADYGPSVAIPPVENARRRGVATLRKQHLLETAFLELWERIRRKTRYAVAIDTERLVSAVVAELDLATIRPPRITVSRAAFYVGSNDEFRARQMSATREVASLAGHTPLPDLLALMADLMDRTTPPVRLTRATLLAIFRRTTQQQAAVDNPQEFAATAVRIIKDQLADQLVAGIKYEGIDDWYQMTDFKEEIPSWLDYLVPAQHSLYDHVACESEIERDFVRDLERRDDVTLYVKLPAWFTVATPVGDYNPDWAIVMEPRDDHGRPTGEQLLYLVRETKSTLNLGELRPDEARKIRCGDAHFRRALDVDYRVVTNARELP